MIDAVIDWNRSERTGLPEAVYAEGKEPQQIDAIVAAAVAGDHRLLLTTLEPHKFAALAGGTRSRLDYDPRSRTAILNGLASVQDTPVAIVTGGLADLPIALEAERTLAFSGVGATMFADVGVAGLWRLMERLEEIRRHRVVIVLAGMEGALFSVLAGLIAVPIIAVPLSVGRGVASGGGVALNSALATCAPGVAVVNIDNGFGAAQVALRILNLTSGSKTE